MKPLKLEIQAFGPFVEKEVLNFGDLGDTPIFLMSGPTGSGKTSILDAICFALFGEMSGTQRDKAKTPRSDRAPADLLTEIVFKFSLGRTKYRIKRWPAQERAKKRGTGTTTEPAGAELKRLKESKAHWIPMESGEKVRQVIEELLGFRAGQFRQIVMLPQGEFARFLRASTNEREDLLEILFGTDAYADLEETLRAKSKAEEERIKELRTVLATLLGDEETTVQALQKQQKTLIEEIEVKKKNLEQLSKQHKAAIKKMEEGRDLIKLFTEVDEAQKALSEIGKDIAEYSNKKRELALAIKCEKIQPLFYRLVTSRNAKESIEKRFSAAESGLKDAEVKLKLAKENYAKEEAREAERKKQSSAVSRLSGLEKEVEIFISLADKIEVTEQLVKKAKQRRQNSERELASQQEEKVQAEGAHVRLETLEVQKKNLAVQQKEITGFIKALSARDEALSQLSGSNETLEIARKKATEIASTLREAKRELKDAGAKRHASAAGLLADGLNEGEPCPVCGSTHHPNTASVAHDSPSEDDIKTLELRIQQIERKGETAQKVHQEAVTKVTLWQERANAATDQLGENKEIDLSQLNNKISSVSAEIETLEKEAAKLKNLKARQNELIKKENELKKVHTDAEEALAAALMDLTEMKTRRVTLEERIPEHCRTEADFAKALSGAILSEKSLREAWHAAQAQLAEAERLVATASATLTGETRAQAEASQAYGEAKRAFAASLEESTFTDETVFLAARLGEEERAALEAEISEFDQAHVAAEDRVRRAAAAIGQKTRPDLAPLEEAAAQAEAALQEARSTHTRLTEQHRALTERLSKIGTRTAELAAAEDQQRLAADMADIAQGRGRNGTGLSFHRWMLAWMFDEVLLAANERLRRFSRGRYRLHRTDEKRSRQRAAGLNLQVIDAYTERPRDVLTLSGGETFLASLALALGLADVVQQHAGARSLETIFIDEGFGHLDADSLDIALRALESLPQAGRSVCIISHVEELATRIQAQVQISPQTSGSSINISGAIPA